MRLCLEYAPAGAAAATCRTARASRVPVENVVSMDSDALALIAGTVMGSGGVYEVGGWLAGRGPARVVDLATPPGPADESGETSFRIRYDGRFENKLRDSGGVGIVGLWHSHPAGCSAELSDADIAAAKELLHRLDLSMVVDVLAVPDVKLANLSLKAWLVYDRFDGETVVEPAVIEELAAAYRLPASAAPAPRKAKPAMSATKAAVRTGCSGCGFAYTPEHKSGHCWGCREAVSR